MKHLFFIILLIINSRVFADIYCPQTITCTARGCSNVPDGFYVNSSYGNFVPGTIYYFDRAIYMDVMRTSYTCSYVTDLNYKNTGLTILSKTPVKSDIKHADNNWVNVNANGGWAGWGGIYICDYNAHHCPFKSF